MLVEWELYKWESMFQMYHTGSTHTALENQLVFVLVFVLSTFLQ